MKQQDKNSYQSSEEVAANSYQPSDYKSSKEVEKGLAMTHEQVSDTYVEGTIDGQINDYEGQNIDLKQQSYEKDVFKKR
ncbi:hypothetical protein JCM9140_637 [Halalkalibacter wakoensis JCM 9140]|uniref:DUF4025 domain-containing protein n=1 Tax=Halalkalibacter wakoensis JCM 9140 TaxID=1236970 RepID=W4PYC5_9BACI|nr:YozQ family protein [Halalkalibacter wakoensis]GAE24690.1 hypothetical protein JCM9140_637 [Halalkalibacter wakoensis JCM 9140]